MNNEAPSYLQGLNPEQGEAVSHFEGPLLVLAGAGSGKTRVLTTRIAHLVLEHGIPAERILALTFTNKAAGEMKDRIRRMLGGEQSGLWIGTFHAVGARLLRRHAPQVGWSQRFTILDAEQSLRLVKQTQVALGIDPKRWHPAAIRSAISGAKNQLVSPEEYTETAADGFDPLAKQVAKTYPAYQEHLQNRNAMDFDDLLVKPVELLEASEALRGRYEERFLFVLVDEYQDTNHAQFRFLELLTRGRRNLMVVGDDDQSIYGWRGADIRNILDFEQTFPEAQVVRLETNYRSTERILDAANAVIRLNLQRKGKTLRTERKGGDPIVRVEAADETDEARWIVEEVKALAAADSGFVYRGAAVLYRTNAQSRALEDAFRRLSVPYQVVGGVRFYERREIQDILAYLRLIANPRDQDAFERVVNYPRRGIGQVSQARVAEWAAREGVSLLEAAARGDEIPGVARAPQGALREFAELIQRFSGRAGGLSVGELLQELVDALDLLEALRAEGPEGDDRADNVKELVAGAMDFDAEVAEGLDEEERDLFTELDVFLQQVALVTDIDRHDPEADAVTLMTLHNAKGLEFPAVWISGLEDGLFPLTRAYDTPEELEEERRLFYVGVTRAQSKLYLTHARQRRRAGDIMYGRPSPFLEAIPPLLLETRTTPRLRVEGTFSRIATRGAKGRRWEREGEDDGFEESLNQDLPRFVKGERVVHATFGSGSIREVSGFGRDLRVTVEFDSLGPKRLLVRYAGLERDFT